ncbi:MAG: hypothetical protein FD189_2566, partial [Elusimicrobia bacterium]
SGRPNRSASRAESAVSLPVENRQSELEKMSSEYLGAVDAEGAESNFGSEPGVSAKPIPTLSSRGALHSEPKHGKVRAALDSASGLGPHRVNFPPPVETRVPDPSQVSSRQAEAGHGVVDSGLHPVGGEFTVGDVMAEIARLQELVDPRECTAARKMLAAGGTRTRSVEPSVDRGRVDVASVRPPSEVHGASSSPSTRHSGLAGRVGDSAAATPPISAESASELEPGLSEAESVDMSRRVRGRSARSAVTSASSLIEEIGSGVSLRREPFVADDQDGDVAMPSPRASVGVSGARPAPARLTVPSEGGARRAYLANGPDPYRSNRFGRDTGAVLTLGATEHRGGRDSGSHARSGTEANSCASSATGVPRRAPYPETQPEYDFLTDVESTSGVELMAVPPERSRDTAARRTVAALSHMPASTRPNTQTQAVRQQTVSRGRPENLGSRPGEPVYRPSRPEHAGPPPLSRRPAAGGSMSRPTQYYTTARTCTGIPSEAQVSRTLSTLGLGVDTSGVDAEGVEMSSTLSGLPGEVLESDDVRNHVAARGRVGADGSAAQRRVLFVSPPGEDSAVSAHTPALDEDTPAEPAQASPVPPEVRRELLPDGVRSITVCDDDSVHVVFMDGLQAEMPVGLDVRRPADLTFVHEQVARFATYAQAREADDDPDSAVPSASRPVEPLRVDVVPAARSRVPPARARQETSENAEPVTTALRRADTAAL